MARSSWVDEDKKPRYDGPTRRALKLFVVLARAGASVGEHARQDILRHNLSVSEFGVLEMLWHKGPQPLGEIADRILLTTGSVTYVIDQLEKQGLVERRPCRTDRRVIFADLTPTGRQRIEAIFSEHAQRIVRAVSGLTPEEQDQAIALLKKLGLAAKTTLP
jgi:MarR family 2-MHQ and catechol resistance regulon transcriptional repressor